MKKRIGLNEKEAKYLGFNFPAPSERWREKQHRYMLTDEQISLISEFRLQPNKRKFVNTQNKLDKNGDVVSSIEKLQSEPIDIPENFEIVKISTSKTTGQQWIQYKPKEKEIKDFDFDSILSKYTENIKPVKSTKVVPIATNDFDTLTYTDVHIGMDTDKYNNSMYAVEWHKESIMSTCIEIAEKTLRNRTADTLIVDELGDFLDGFNAQTTRGGHHLPQNMTNEEAFDCALSFKMQLVDMLYPYYSYLSFNNICNDNHAGAFGYFVNKAFKEIVSQKYPNVEVKNYRKFINHYYVGDVCFIITHGKDDSTLKFGFKPQLDTKSIEKIDQYCKHNNIYKHSKLVIFKKGDSHQALFDMCSSDDFYYYNYPAASPSSQWVQNNFKKGRRGFVLESYNGLENSIKPFFFK